MRTLARSVAHANMRKAGLSDVNRKHGTKSYFAKHWREYVHSTTGKGKGKRL